MDQKYSLDLCYIASVKLAWATRDLSTKIKKMTSRRCAGAIRGGRRLGIRYVLWK